MCNKHEVAPSIHLLLLILHLFPSPLFILLDTPDSFPSLFFLPSLRQHHRRRKRWGSEDGGDMAQEWWGQGGYFREPLTWALESIYLPSFCLHELRKKKTPVCVCRVLCKVRRFILNCWRIWTERKLCMLWTFLCIYSDFLALKDTYTCHHVWGVSIYDSISQVELILVK